MKVNKYGIICALALLSGVVGCEDSSSLLDKEESNDIYENMVFSDPYNATWFLSNIYKSMNDGFMVFGSDDSGGFLGNAVDEGIWKANWDNAYKMSVGAWATTDMLLNYDPWKKYYTAIRAACRFLEHADEIPDSPEPFIDEGVRTRMKGEARFLRALFYYELLKFYGGVPIVTRVLGPDDAAELHGARAGFDEVVEFICSEAMLAAGDLPHVDEYADSEWGRATKGACYALISRVRLLAASPLFNDRQNPSGSACRGEYSAEKWKTAAEAAKYFLENTRGYALHRSTDPERYGDYEDLFLRRYSPEIILAYQQDQFAVRLERNCLPGQLFNYAFGVLNNFPTLNTVAEYEVVKLDDQGNVVSTHLLGLDKLLKLHETNGTDPESGFDPQNPYVNRDPRFYRDIIYHGSMFKGKWINTATGADAINAANSTSTGYFTRKYFDGYYTKGMSGNWNFDAPLIRLATIYLVYAEAVTRSKGATPEVYNLMNELRARSFMAPIPPAAQTNKELLLDYILRERRVELYHEKSRFFSTRFYLEPTSPEELAKDAQWSSIQGTNDQKAQLYFDKYGAYPKTQHRICGMRPVEDPNGKISVGGKTYRMERFWKEDRVFLEKHYLFPIPTEELQRANIPQNPNW